MTTAQRTSPTSILVTRTDGATFTITGKATCAKPIVVAWERDITWPATETRFVAQATKDRANAEKWVRTLQGNSYDRGYEIVTVTD